MRPSKSSSILFALSVIGGLTLLGCHGAPVGDDAPEVDVTDGKTDGLSVFGSYENPDAAVGELLSIQLVPGNTYHRETRRACSGSAPCKPKVEEGTFKSTRGNATYLRFLDKSGALVDRYAWQRHGRELRLRNTQGRGDWQTLTEVAAPTIDSPFAGYYTHWDSPLPKGSVYALFLDDSGRFEMSVQALIGCKLPGHSCPGSWSDGYTGDTILSGRWEPTDDGARLVPRNDATGEESPPIDLGLSIAGGKLAIDGAIGSVTLHGGLDVEVLFNDAHTASAEDLDGSWRITKGDENGDDDVVLLTGFAQAINGGTSHTVDIDAASGALVETGPNKNSAPLHARYRVGANPGDPTGSKPGMLFFWNDRDEEVTLRIVSVTSSKLRLQQILTDEPATFELTRQ